MPVNTLRIRLQVAVRDMGVANSDDSTDGCSACMQNRRPARPDIARNGWISERKRTRFRMGIAMRMRKICAAVTNPRVGCSRITVHTRYHL